jgi:hypothetical protein
VDRADQRAAGRKAQLFFRVPLLCIFGAILVSKAGLWAALVIIACLIVATSGVIVGLRVKNRRQESERRKNGKPPSWSVLLDAETARTLGFEVPPRLRDRIEAFGRIYFDGTRFWCSPTERTASKGFFRGKFSWDYNNPMSLKPEWGFGQQGQLILRLDDQQIVSLWIRETKDFSTITGVPIDS